MDWISGQSVAWFPSSLVEGRNSWQRKQRGLVVLVVVSSKGHGLLPHFACPCRISGGGGGGRGTVEAPPHMANEQRALVEHASAGRGAGLAASAWLWKPDGTDTWWVGRRGDDEPSLPVRMRRGEARAAWECGRSPSVVSTSPVPSQVSKVRRPRRRPACLVIVSLTFLLYIYYISVLCISEGSRTAERRPLLTLSLFEIGSFPKQVGPLGLSLQF